MSTFNYYFWRIKGILLKIETVVGTDPIPTAAANGVLAMNLACTIEGDKLERVIDRQFFTANPFVLINRRCTVEFDFEPLGNSAVGTSAPCSAILQACGFSETLVASTSSTFAPVSTGIKSATIYFYWADNLVNINECRGSVAFDFTINQFGKAHAKFTGLFAVPTTATLVTPVTTIWQDPPAITMATAILSINSILVNGKVSQLDMASEIKIHEGTEYRDILMTNRAPLGTVRFYYGGQALFDLFAIASAHTKVPVVFTVDGGTGKKMVMTMQSCEFLMPKFTEIDGTVGLEAQFAALPVAGNDEVSIAFT